MSPTERLRLLLFLALFSAAVGLLSTGLCGGTEYWLLAAGACSPPEGGRGGRGLRAGDSSMEAGVRIFHEGLFWRCSFMAASHEHSVWDLWISNQPPSKVCQAAFLFPFPVNEPMRSWAEPRGLPTEPYEHYSAIVFRTFWSIFLVTGFAAVVTGGFVVLCAGPLTNHKLYKVGGALLLCGGVCLLAVVVMYLTWVQILDTLEEFAHHQSLAGCPLFHLSVQHGPSFLLAPVAVFFCLLAGLLFVLLGQRIQSMQQDKKDIPQIPASDVCL